MSTDQQVYEAIAQGVAEAREPDLTPFAPDDVRGAVQRALSAPRRQAFLAWLGDRVHVLSDGRISVDQGPGVQDLAAGDPGPASDEVAMSLVIEGEPFREPVLLRDVGPIVQFPMRG